MADAAENELRDEKLLSVRAVATALLYFAKLHGKARLAEVVKPEKVGASLAELQVLTNNISLRTCEELFDTLAEASGRPDFMREAGLSTATPEALGFLFQVMRAFGNPRLCYVKTVEIGAAYNRIGAFSLEDVTANSARLVYRSRVPERNRNICELRMGQFASFPTIWGLPAAEVTEETCHVHGADACRYRLRWQNPIRAWRRLAGLAAGAAGATAAWRLGVSDAWLSAVALTGFGTAVGAWFDARAELGARNEDLRAQTEGLIQSLHDLQRRHDEVQKARTEVERTNRELEQRVQERTGELATANQQLGHALEQARELDRLKTEFFDNVSHELRTPLALILLSLDSLEGRGEQASPGNVRTHLDTIERSASRLLRLINQLLDIAKIEAGKTRLRYQEVELHALLASLILPFGQLATQRRITLSLEGAPAEAVQVDAEKIDIVFQNLLSNAIKFTPEGGKVKVRLRELADAIEVDVEDTGAGIAAADLPLIFDRFSQADSKGIKRFGGSGIGLALVKETVELHGGTIRVRSEPGNGSCFTVRVPRGTAHIRDELRERRKETVPVPWDRRSSAAPLDSVRSRREDAPAEPDAPEASLPADAPRVLVVEDDPDLRRVIVGALRTRYHVTEAADGVEGEERALDVSPALIVSDLMMPRRSGLQLLERLRANPKTVDVPFILLTARRETDAVVEGLTTGANDYLGKPFAARELMARVETQLRLREAAVRSATAERLSALGLLTSGFAHEVRNPLNGLLNAVEPLRSMLSDPAAHADAEELLNVIRDCGGRVQGLAESLLGFARPAAEPGDVDVAATLESTLSILRWRLTPEVQLQTELEVRPAVRGEAAALNQVWLNLLDNALRAVGRSGTITVRTERAGPNVRISVRDTGPGIDDRIRATLFEPFFSTRPAGEGTGLGLALCRRIVLAHGGTIRVDSSPGQGATFTVELPVSAEVAASLPARPTALRLQHYH